MMVWLAYPFNTACRLGPIDVPIHLPPFDPLNFERTTIARIYIAAHTDKWSAPHEPDDFVVAQVTTLDDNTEIWHLDS